MSMVGYLLGLGDRHPSNLMLHRFSGKILHIGFGDCFQASMNREKFPEKVAFRLTRMLVKAMEVSGIEGNFQSTCENVMQVLRTNKDSVMAMMEESAASRELPQPQRSACERELLEAVNLLVMLMRF
ncbi:serine/threonine-protein kinase TOR isoform X2 [Manihot esculenta]|uniref:serine/threonine-protein kinase TOR isoform X2 n=1 Tax=Manihot esculenta TaxID=3983 RepID=UPI001CC69478|nr:serine/threonine-protein kinase TOR isoform X2 [Manihot esculenta]